MNRKFLLFGAIAILLCSCCQENKTQSDRILPEPRTEEEQAKYEAFQEIMKSWRPDLEKNHLEPKDTKDGYTFSANYGASIAVLGGSLSVNEESNAAKQVWADKLGASVTTYGVGGAGFSREQGYSLQFQADTLGVHDVYVLWASTNDFTNDREIGCWSDYTEYDGYDDGRRSTQCGGINYCIKKIYEINPYAKIYFFTSLRMFMSDSGYNPYSKNANRTGKTFAEYIDAQKETCAYWGIPVLDQFAIQGVNPLTYKQFYKDDSLHMTEEGYRRIAPAQAAFLANN